MEMSSRRSKSEYPDKAKAPAFLRHPRNCGVENTQTHTGGGVLGTGLTNRGELVAAALPSSNWPSCEGNSGSLLPTSTSTPGIQTNSLLQGVHTRCLRTTRLVSDEGGLSTISQFPRPQQVPEGTRKVIFCGACSGQALLCCRQKPSCCRSDSNVCGWCYF